jgi:phosphoserine phosphatase RsbU/P
MAETEHMQCMEVWGGSETVRRGVEMGGMDTWVYSRPFGNAEDGGDVYYASSCATGRITRLMVADVAGHGKAVAATAASLRSLMRRYVNFLDQKKFVRSMNQKFAAMSEDGCFATALVSTFFAPTRRLSICNAGHPRPLHYRVADKTWSILEQKAAHDERPSNIPLGILDLAEYEQFEVQLAVGDLVIFYTDAITEARDKDGELLGEAGLLEIARSLPMDDPDKLIDKLLEAVGALHAGNLSADDVTVLLLCPNGRRPRFSFSEKLWAQIRLVGQLVRSIDPRAERPQLPDLNLANIGGAVFPWMSKRGNSNIKNAE